MRCAAFIIGIDNYDNYHKLNCAVKDATDVVKVLEYLKFEVTLLTNCTFDKAHKAINCYTDKLFQKYDAAVFYFAGHGAMINRTDCLLMKDAPKFERGDDIKPKAYCLMVDEIMHEFNGVGNQANIFIIDACRVSYENCRGLSAIEFGTTINRIPYQTFMSFSTSPGDSADDGLKGHNSPFAAALLSHIEEEDLDIEMLFKKVRTDIKNDGRHQYPWEHTCLIDRFCFNHGQLSKYYNQPYCKEAFIRSKYPTATDTIPDIIIQDLTSGNSEGQNRAFLTLFANKQLLSETQKFVIGRYIYVSAAIGNNPSIDFLSSTSNLLRFQSDKNNHLLRGIYYEIFFDEDDVLRERPLGDSNLLTVIERLRVQINDKDSESFVADKLPIEYFKKGYALGKTPDWKFKVKLSDSGLYDEEWKEIKQVDDIIVDDESVLSRLKENQDNLLMGWNILRCKVANEFAIPFQKINLSVSTSIRDKFSKVVLIEDFPDIEDFILDECRRETPSEVDVLSSLSYIEELEDYSLSFVGQNDGELTIKGNMTVSVHLEYDREDVENMSFPGSFSIYLLKNEKNTEWILSTRKSQIKINTESFYI